MLGYLVEVFQNKIISEAQKKNDYLGPPPATFGTDQTRETVNEETIGIFIKKKKKLGSGRACALMEMYRHPKNSIHLL